jgi:benzoyl-CoA reductase subunit C
MVDKFQRIFQKRLQIIQEHQANRQKAFGYICTYTPEEIIYAAGILPVRVFGKPGETPVADAYLYSNICSFVRSCFEQALQDGYSNIDGLLACNSCDHIRRLYDAWQNYIPTPFTYIFSLPCKTTPSTLAFFQQELNQFKDHLERYLGHEITTKDLQEAITVYNQTRQLLRRLYQLRQSHPPLVTGAEALEIVRAGMVMPKPEFNHLLEEFLTERETSSPQQNNNRVRLLILGSELDDPEYLQLIEDLGAIIVADDLCIGTRYFWDLVDPQLDPIEGIAQRYLTRTPCPRMHPAGSRIEHLTSLIEHFKVEGIIYETIKFCDLHSSGYPLIKKGLEQLDLPILKLEREYNLASVGQMRTRVEAFLENIRSF